MQCAPEAAKILSQYGAEKHQRKSISQFSLSFFVLRTHVLSLLAHREFWYMPSTPRGSVGPIFPRDGLFSVTVWLSWTFARSIGLKTLCSSVVSMKTSAARRPEAFSTNCHAYSTLPLNFSHSALRASGSTVHQSDGASKHTFCRIHRKMELCNYHSGQHCGWDSFQMDCAHGPSSRAFPPIFSFRRLAETWDFLTLLILKIHSSWKSVRIPVDGLFRNQKLELKIEKLSGILAILAQDWLWSRSPLSVPGVPVHACTGIFPLTEKSLELSIPE